ncbi:MAG: anthranilate synthase component I [Acidobacteria bacterium]|nr:anthranilate synthase component I [Acidobacteriota bacterium]
MISPDFQEFTRLSRQGNWVPVWTTVPADLLTPVSAYLKLTREKAKGKGRIHPYSFLLESVEGGETIARYTYLGVDPVMVLRYWIEDGGGGSRSEWGRMEVSVAGSTEMMRGDFLSMAKNIFADFRHAPTEGLPPFTAGAVGYIGYDMISLWEPVPLPPSERSRLGRGRMPDAVLMFTSTVLVFDHVKHQIWIVCNVPCEPNSKRSGLQHAYRRAQRDIQGIEKRLAGPLPVLESKKRSGQRRPAPVFRSNVTKKRFMNQVRRAKEHIQAGDIFQVVLSQRLETKIHAKAFDVYRALRRVNPAPYLFFLQMGEDSVLGSSPEMLVKITGEDVEYRPIAGTRRRGEDIAEDQRLERELLADEKERAEHIMLVDLGRNDVGRVCRFGSVQVPNLMFVERYSHVMHLVSSVRGKLRKELDAWDALGACFPAGTVTGAPKVRAMQIISELEPTRRGLYAGSVLYFDLTGNLNSCIAIRSIVIRKGKVTVQVGAGIVADSVPEREFEETMNKGKAMLKAIELVEQEGAAGKRR